jgi:hypothetical protein
MLGRSFGAENLNQVFFKHCFWVMKFLRFCSIDSVVGDVAFMPCESKKWNVSYSETFKKLLNHRPDDGCSTHIWKVGLLQRYSSALYSRKLPPSLYPIASQFDMPSRCFRSWGSTVGIVSDYRVDDRGLIPGRDMIFPLASVSRLDLRPTKPPV